MNPNDSAFSKENHSGPQGLTKREYFAIFALQGICVPCIPGRENANDANESVYKVQMALRLADALIEELNK